MSWLGQFYWKDSKLKQAVAQRKILQNYPVFFAVLDSKVLELKTEQVSLCTWDKSVLAYAPRVWICASTGFSVGQNN